jgi:echinoid protein
MRTFSDFPRVVVGPENPLKVEMDETAQLECTVDSKPSVSTVKWYRNGRFIDTHFKHTIPRATLQDAGSYVCSADNGLGQVGKAELVLDVLHAPVVTLEAKREVKEGQNVAIECKFTSNPRPASIQWYKDGDDKFHQNGPTLKLNGINAKHNGIYVCSVTNYIQPTGRPKSVRTGNATIAINVRHQPGKSFIAPDRPTAVEGKSITLVCGAKPPGYPVPEYRWWKEGTDSKTLARGSEFTIDYARLSTAGKYFCQPTNELGEGSVASVHLSVYQAPKIITQLQPTIMTRAGDTGFHITCSAVGKPKPQVKQN